MELTHYFPSVGLIFCLRFATVASLAVGTDEEVSSDIPVGPIYRFTAWHLVELDAPWAVFPRNLIQE